MNLIDPVILWTDSLIYLLLALTIFAAVTLRKNQQFMTQWRVIFHSTAASISVVVLSLYVIIGLLDTLHFHPLLKTDATIQTSTKNQHSAEVISALDWLLNDLKNQSEKSYSAPFATHLFVKETIETNGIQSREFPRLVFAGQHLLQDDQLTSDVMTKLFVGLLLGVLVWFLLMAVLKLFLFKDKSIQQFLILLRVKNTNQIAWNAISQSVLISSLILVSLLYLSQYYHVLGTDKVGGDVFYQALKSIRTGLVIGTLTTLIMLPFALLLGIMAGYYKGWVDDVIQYTYTTLNSVPGILLIAASVLMLQVYMDNNASAFTTVEQRSDARLFFLCMILGITSWTGLCRLLRGEALKLRELEYIQAAKTLGSSDFKIIVQHILPNVMHLVLISIVLDFSGLVLAEAVLAYVEIGVDPTMNSWGNMINSARLEMSREPIVWWSLFAAFCFMFVLVLAANLFADAVRDAFDPRTRSRQ